MNVDDFDKLRWTLVKVNNSANGTFYLKSTKYDEYLCASNSFADLYGMRRNIMRLQIDMTYTSFHSKCQWKLEKINSNLNDNTYSIWNLMYQEPLYAASFLFKETSNKRSIFLWYKPSINSNKLKWTVDCISDETRGSAKI